MGTEGTMITKQTAIKRFLAYCKRKPSRRIGTEFYQYQQDVYEMDDQNCKIRIFTKKSQFKVEHRMIIFHGKQDCERSGYPPISEISLTEDEFEMLKNEYLK